LKSAAVSKGMRKCFDLVANWGNEKTQHKKKRKRKDDDKSQTKLDMFFTGQKKTQST